MRIGIHTGRVVAGIIGSKVVRYDIFGEGVLTAYKMESNGEPGQVHISDDTRKILMTQPDVANEYTLTRAKQFTLKSINKNIVAYNIERRETESMDQLTSEFDDSMGSKYSKKSLTNNSARDQEYSTNMKRGMLNSYQSDGDNDSDASADDNNYNTSRPLL